MASLILAIVGASFGIGVAAAKAYVPPAVGGGLLGLSIAGMHYVGMLAYRIDATIRWHGGYVVASIVVAAALGALGDGGAAQ